jgi:hypothetical protein
MYFPNLVLEPNSVNSLSKYGLFSHRKTSEITSSNYSGNFIRKRLKLQLLIIEQLFLRGVSNSLHQRLHGNRIKFPMMRSHMFPIILFAAHQSRTELTLDLLFFMQIQNVSTQICFDFERTVAMGTRVFSDSTVNGFNMALQFPGKGVFLAACLESALKLPLFVNRFHVFRQFPHFL